MAASVMSVSKNVVFEIFISYYSSVLDISVFALYVTYFEYFLQTSKKNEQFSMFNEKITIFENFRYTNADLKNSIYVCVHIKTIS